MKKKCKKRVLGSSVPPETSDGTDGWYTFSGSDSNLNKVMICLCLVAKAFNLKIIGAHCARAVCHPLYE